MPDLKSQLAEVKHKLATMAFDDEGEATTTTTQTEEAMADRTTSRKLWLYIKDHPSVTGAEAGQGAGIDRTSASSLTSQMFMKGVLKRDKPSDGGPYRYTVVDPDYVPLTSSEAILRANAARAAKAAKPKAKVKPKAKEVAAAQLPPTAKFTATIPQLLDTLSVVQARALYDALKKIFGA